MSDEKVEFTQEEVAQALMGIKVALSVLEKANLDLDKMDIPEDIKQLLEYKMELNASYEKVLTAMCFGMQENLLNMGEAAQLVSMIFDIEKSDAINSLVETRKKAANIIEP